MLKLVAEVMRSCQDEDVCSRFEVKLSRSEK